MVRYPKLECGTGITRTWAQDAAHVDRESRELWRKMPHNVTLYFGACPRITHTGGNASKPGHTSRGVWIYNATAKREKPRAQSGWLRVAGASRGRFYEPKSLRREES
jgi:hypothetical protein